MWGVSRRGTGTAFSCTHISVIVFNASVHIGTSIAINLNLAGNIPVSIAIAPARGVYP